MHHAERRHLGPGRRRTERCRGTNRGNTSAETSRAARPVVFRTVSDSTRTTHRGPSFLASESHLPGGLRPGLGRVLGRWFDIGLDGVNHNRRRRRLGFLPNPWAWRRIHLVGTTGAAPDETTGSSTSSTGSPPSSSAETGSSNTGVSSSTGSSSSTGGSSTTDASSSSTGQPPDQPDGVAPDWTLSIEGFDGDALKVLDDGRTAIGRQEGDVAIIHIVDPAGALLPGHAIDPTLWDAAPASERVLELDRLDAYRLAVLVSRGADNEYSAYGGVLEFDVSPGSTGDLGWSALIEGVVLHDEPGFFVESVPGVTQQQCRSQADARWRVSKTRTSGSL